jgi:hypothetical protein
MTDGPILVYVHGAGNQGKRSGDDLKRGFDAALFGVPGPSIAPTWWQVFWDRPGAERAEKALEATIERLASNPSSPESDAAELLRAIRKARPPLPREPGLEGLLEDSTHEAIDAIHGFYDAASDAQGPDEMPEWIFRIIAGQASADVVPYLYDGWAERMRKPIKEKLRELGADQAIVVLAHSLGSVLAYDVLADPEFKSWKLQLLVTAGSPLGIENVVAKVRDRKGPGPLPATASEWRNFYDMRDLVGKFGESLKGKYLPKPPLREKLTVKNERPGHHDLVGYLVDRDLQAVVRAAVGMGPP